MGRNQYDISDNDMRELRANSDASHKAQAALTPAQQHAERGAQTASLVTRATEQNARKKAERDADATALEEDRRQFEIDADEVVRRLAERGIAFPRPEYRHPLFRLSEENYSAYLVTFQWKAIRRRVFKRDGDLCKLCGKKAQCVHHISYEQDVMIGENDDELISLCNICHKGIEYDGERHRDEKEKRALLQQRLEGR